MQNARRVVSDFKQYKNLLALANEEKADTTSTQEFSPLTQENSVQKSASLLKSEQLSERSTQEFSPLTQENSVQNVR